MPGMRTEQTMVREFHEAFGHPVAPRPAMLEPRRVQNRSNWMSEEVEEFKAAQTLEDQADAMIDLLYFALGTLVELGVDAETLFHLVHRANMGKLWPDGKARFHPDGKVLKPPTWRDPGDALRQEIARQLATV
jgi:predicted HAD superfamily Cof-like phosphohydrolase